MPFFTWSNATSRILRPGALALFVLLPLGKMTLAGPENGNLPSVSTILEKALERAHEREEPNFQTLYRFEIHSKNHKLDRQGNISETEDLVYENHPILGFAFRRLVRRDGDPLSPSEQRKEDKREKAFRRKAAAGKDPAPDDRAPVRFDESLVNRYDFTLEERISHLGRDTFRMSFEPKDQKLPVTSRIDEALNRSTGELWVDTETHEVSRVHFELRDRISIWWGMVGHIDSLKGTVERAPLGDGVWVMRGFQLELEGQILFFSLNRRIEQEWHSFVPVRGEGPDDSASLELK